SLASTLDNEPPRQCAVAEHQRQISPDIAAQLMLAAQEMDQRSRVTLLQIPQDQAIASLIQWQLHVFARLWVLVPIVERFDVPIRFGACVPATDSLGDFPGRAHG